MSLRGAALACACVLGAAVVGPAAEPRPAAGSGRVVTVTGLVEAGALGPTLMHEHVLRRPRPRAARPRGAALALYDRPLALDILDRVEMGAPNRDNEILGDEGVAARELRVLRAAGGRGVVDLTAAGEGRDPEALRRIARAAGVSLVMAAGAYRTGGGSAAAAEAPDTRTERLVREITLGVGATGIRAGILGEVALASGPLDPRTAGVLRATARASRRTGAAIVLGGPAPVESVARALDLLAGEGADTGRVVVGGADPLARDPAALERLLARGVMLQFDMLGRYPHVRSRSDDTEVAQAVVALVRAGHAGRILLSQDVRTKLQLASYGGTGYAFVLRQFVPYLESLGLSRAEIETLLVANPARLLALAVPR